MTSTSRREGAPGERDERGERDNEADRTTRLGKLRTRRTNQPTRLGGYGKTRSHLLGPSRHVCLDVKGRRHENTAGSHPEIRNEIRWDLTWRYENENDEMGALLGVGERAVLRYAAVRRWMRFWASIGALLCVGGHAAGRQWTRCWAAHCGASARGWASVGALLGVDGALLCVGGRTAGRRCGRAAVRRVAVRRWARRWELMVLLALMTTSDSALGTSLGTVPAGCSAQGKNRSA